MQEIIEAKVEKRTKGNISMICILYVVVLLVCFAIAVAASVIVSSLYYVAVVYDNDVTVVFL